jgi:hypothetical protein
MNSLKDKLVHICIEKMSPYMEYLDMLHEFGAEFFPPCTIKVNYGAINAELDFKKMKMRVLNMVFELNHENLAGLLILLETTPQPSEDYDT